MDNQIEVFFIYIQKYHIYSNNITTYTHTQYIYIYIRADLLDIELILLLLLYSKLIYRYITTHTHTQYIYMIKYIIKTNIDPNNY